MTFPPWWPAAISQRPKPAAACVTTTRFMRAGPGPSGPRSPAVPNSSGPANAAVSSVRADSSPDSYAAISSSSRATVSASGSWARQLRAVEISVFMSRPRQWVSVSISSVCCSALASSSSSHEPTRWSVPSGVSSSSTSSKRRVRGSVTSRRSESTAR